MSKSTILHHSNKVADQVLREVTDFEEDEISLSKRATFKQYQTIQDIKTHQNGEFLLPLAPGQDDDREFYDIITPMVETAVVNADIDSENLEAYTEGKEHQVHQYFAKAILKTFLRQTHHGIVLNELIYDFIDDGNLIVRRTKDGDIYRPCLPQNIIVTDQTYRTLEDTDVIEKDIMSQSELRGMTEWDRIDEVIESCNLGDDGKPYYEVFFREGELTQKRLGMVKQEVHGIKYKYKTGDNNNFVQALVVVVRAKDQVTQPSDDDDVEPVRGIVVFAEELKPKTIKITKRLKIKRYKSYEHVRLGKYTGRGWGKGYREIGIPYQNRANELGNQIRLAMKVASKIIFWSTDEKVAGKNILSSIKNGQILQAKDLYLLNNVFPNLSLYAEEWNRNMTECQKALKAFEAASGELMPSSASATAVVAQNQAIGKYYNFKSERFGLFLSIIFKRWAMPDLLNGMDLEEAIELTGDPSVLEEIIDAYVNGWIIQHYLKFMALTGGAPNKEAIEQIKEMKKEELLKRPKLWAKVAEDFIKDVEYYVAFNVTGEMFNKQNKITNGLKLIELEANPAISQNPELRESVNDIRLMLGFKPIKISAKQPAMAPVGGGKMNLPQTEEPAGRQMLNGQ